MAIEKRFLLSEKRQLADVSKKRKTSPNNTMKNKNSKIVYFFETSADWYFLQKRLRKDAFRSNRQASLPEPSLLKKRHQNVLGDILYCSVSGSTLPTVIVISTLMLLAVMGIFSIWDKNNNALGYELYRTQQMLDLESAVTLYCHDTLLLKKHSDVEVTITQQGLYEIIKATTKDGKFSKQALLGCVADSTVLYLEDNGRPISLTGATNIVGQVYLPRYGVAYNQIQSDFFSGKKLENIKVSATKLPEIRDVDTILQRKIVVEDGYCGELQLFAIDTVIIGENVKLKYPSGIYVENGYVEIKDNAEVNGYIIIANSSDGMKPSYKQSQTAKVRGTIYINGTAQLQGVISGAIYAKTCSIFLPEGIYTNTIYNLTAIRNSDIASPIIIKNAPHERRLIKWCN